jgi:hypothetical protein
MFKILSFLFLIYFGTTIVFSQKVFIEYDASDYAEGGNYTKRIEYNFRGDYLHNLKNKTALQKLLFGDFNGQLEFIVEPSFAGVYGVRLVRDSLDTSYLLELKGISNYQEVQHKILEENIPVGKMWEESFKRYEVETKYVPIKDDFAEKLYAKVVDAIDNFKGKGIPPVIFDGYEVTFRCVVEYELWELTIHEPGGYMKNLTNLFNQLIKDAEANTLDESKYITLLDELK